MGQPIVRYESGQTSYAFEAMTDSGDNTTFSASFSPLSRASGYAPTVAPYGLKTGGAITPGSSNDEVDVAALTVVAPGMTGADSSGVVSVSADTVSITRGLTTDTHNITSITVDSSGAIAAVAGTDSTAFSETRGAAGGPPLIPVGSVEIGQVRTTSVTAAIVLAGEIYQVPGLTLERSDYPAYTVDYANGEITFVDALPLIHTGGVPKKVYIKGATPLFAPVPKASDWVPAEATYSITSTDTYDGPVGSSSSSLGQASFNAVLTDGITDNFVSLKGQNLWVEFRPDRDVSVPKQLTQGIFGISRTFPAGGGSVSASCTVTPTDATVDVAS
ncbi:MAG: hypothetical protein V2I38_08925 [Alcanivoracaceae bacterium]|nr:hypothetical protein [Alcanivoracaceae bacterium]